MTTLSLKVPELLERRLTRLAESRGESRSEVMRKALVRFLDETAAQPDSCLARAAGLVGCVEGPADLSHNKKHLEGFGK